MSDGMISSLPTKLDVISRTHENVLDFQVTHARLWNKSKHTKRERRLFSKTCDWNNVEVARKNGYMWCAQCEDKGFIYCLRGIIRCNCAATGYEEIRRLKFKTLKLSQEVKQACQNTSK